MSKMIEEIVIVDGKVGGNILLRLIPALFFWLMAAGCFTATICYGFTKSLSWNVIAMGIGGGILGVLLGLFFGGFVSAKTLFPIVILLLFFFCGLFIKGTRNSQFRSFIKNESHMGKFLH